MKKILLLIIISVAVVGCKKTEFEPKGPTDVRVKNISDVTFSEIIVKIDDEVDTIGIALPGGYTDYHRFKTAYPKAEISARINGVLYTTGPVDNTYSQYMGLMKITYVVYISSMNLKELKIDDVLTEEPLVLK